MGYAMGVTLLACVAASSFRCLMRQLAVSFIKRVELVNLRRTLPVRMTLLGTLRYPVAKPSLPIAFITRL